MLKICGYCGEPFEVDEFDHNDVRRKYCGYYCAQSMKTQQIKEYKQAGKKAHYEKVCIVCGVKFTTNKDRQLVCGDRCAKERKRLKAYEYNKSKAIPKPKIEKKPKKSNAELIIEKDRKAKEMGMSYGQYDAWLRIQADREARERNGNQKNC